jgi:hypothetical protein
MNHPNGANLRTVLVFDPSTDRFIQVVMRPGWKRMQWTTVVVMDESDLDMACGSRNFEDGELLTRACIFEANGVSLALRWSVHHGLADHWTMDSIEIDIGDIYPGRPLPLRRSFQPMIKYLEILIAMLVWTSSGLTCSTRHRHPSFKPFRCSPCHYQHVNFSSG